METLGIYGITERFPHGDEIDEAVAELRINGYTVIQSGFSPDFIASLQDGLERAYVKQVAEIGSETILHAMRDTDIARCILSYEPDYIRVATANPLMELARRYLGPSIILMMQNGILNRPEREHYQSKWHRDLNYQHWTSSKPLAINALLCLDDFTLENGATFVLPGTQHVDAFPTDAFAHKHQRQITASAGSFVVLDAMVYHRAGINRSLNIRRAVNHVIGLPFMAQQVGIPSAMSRNGIDVPSDPFIRSYLGYKWSPAVDAIDWRRRRIG